MFSTGQLLAFTATALVLIVIPGPSVMYVVGRALAAGRRQAVLSAIGNCAGEFTAAVLAAIGLGALLQQSALAFGIVKYAGAAYLIYLGVKALRGRKQESDEAEIEPVGRRRTTAMMFEGFLVGLLNPKSILFFVALLPQFVNPGAGSVTMQMLILGGIFAILAGVCDSLWALAASAARNMLSAPRPKRILAHIGGTSMIGLGVAAAAGDRA
ncbi:LysE family translocator [Glycomyces buryatensis]|uniref:LysE family translocator n=1 Tax=Glycomyces buryatensis TaxID=2570927 RepID=A0A4V4HS21_9ACTN|nr:LysE family translocator [Glycomyces buryatensis]THV40146.1 LysE family translocator [Glycomyces buryatensis]